MRTVLPATNCSLFLLLLLLLSRAVTELFNLAQMPTTATTTAAAACKLPASKPYLWLKLASPLGILFAAFNLMRFSQNEKNHNFHAQRSAANCQAGRASCHSSKLSLPLPRPLSLSQVTPTFQPQSGTYTLLLLPHFFANFKFGNFLLC